MKLTINENRILGVRDQKIYGHFLEHFHRQVYGGVYDPGNSLSDENGLRMDVLDAMRKIKVPIIRWPGGCFVSAYHWKTGIGKNRIPTFDKAWRVEEPNAFGTDEFMDLCAKVGCEPYICFNAGTGTPEEMSDWVEYCNLENEGVFSKQRIANGHNTPYRVKYWSIGNENYGNWELGAKTVSEWARFVTEAAKMIKRVDHSVELSAAAIPDLDWNVNLLRQCAEYLDWISLHSYWDGLTNRYASFEEVMVCTNHVDDDIRKVKGLLTAMGLEKRVKIAYDEWNLRGWYHPHFTSAVSSDICINERNENDNNSVITMADALFTACFLNACNRHCDVVKMANFSPIVNTRGCIYTYPKGIVLRSTYYVFDLYVNVLGDQVIDYWVEEAPFSDLRNKMGGVETTAMADVMATKREGMLVLSVVNKDAEKPLSITLSTQMTYNRCRVHILTGSGTDVYNDIGKTEIATDVSAWMPYSRKFTLPAHSLSVIEISQ